MSGIEGVRWLRERYPHIVPLILTIYEDDARIFNALCAGACGYLLKKTPPARLLEDSRRRSRAARPCRPRWRRAWSRCFATRGRPIAPTTT
jgi:DNA-binding NarL/FixJ family response regulator